MTQIQVRIDLKTKKQAKEILNKLGLDISSAVKMMLKQVVSLGVLPYEIRDVNGFTARKALELKESIIDAKNSKQSFASASDLIKDALS